MDAFEQLDKLEETFKHPGFEIQGALLTKYKKDKTDVQIPKDINEIGPEAFSGTNIYRITIPASVHKIDARAFANCKNLMFVNMTDNVEYIGDGAFEGCSNLENINLPDSLTNISNNLFKGCSKLNIKTIPNSAQTIGNLAFSGCSAIKEMNLKDTHVTVIGKGAFNSCNNLKSITFPNTLTRILADAFIHCVSLTNVDIPDSVTALGIGCFEECKSLQHVKLSRKMIRLCGSCFRNSGLVDIVIPKSISIIGTGVFSGCGNLKTIRCEASNKPNKWEEDWNLGCNANIQWGKNEVLETLDIAERNKIDDIDNLITSIYEMRQQSLARDGEYGIGNLVFKEFRNRGYLRNLKDLKMNLKSKELCLEEKSIFEDIEKHDTLNPKLFEDDKLKPEVREKIIEIAKDYVDSLTEDGIKIYVSDVVLVGSNVSYNYSDKSDLDIHIMYNLEKLHCPDNLYPLLYSAYRSIFEKKRDIDFYGIEVEIYAEDIATTSIRSNGIYSVLKDEWIKHPEADVIPPEIDKEAFEREFKIWEDRYEELMEGETVEIGE